MPCKVCGSTTNKRPKKSKTCHKCLAVRYASTRKANARRQHLRIKYGITEAQYDALLQAQNGKCRICGTAGKLHVDHDHGTGRIRGLLCHQCNVGLGHFRDRPDLLTKAIEYLA